MSEIDGGALSFKSVMDNDQMNAAIDETLRRVQGLSDGTVAGGNAMDKAFKTAEDSVKNFTLLTAKSGANIDAEYKKTSGLIEKGFEIIGNGIKLNQSELKKLTDEFTRLGVEANKAGGHYQTKFGGSGYLTAEQSELREKIKILKQVEKGLQDQDQALLKLNADTNTHKTKLDNTSNAQVTFRTELGKIKQQMMELDAIKQKDGSLTAEQSAKYVQLTEEAKRLGSAIYSANQQVKLITSTKGEMLQGLMSGLSGVAGGFSAVTGAVSMFAGANEDLQKIMLKVQSLMAITIGLQQVSQTLNKDSAFRLKTLTQIQNIYSAAISNTGKAFIKMGFSATAARIAAQALMATLTLGLGVAITTAITMITKWVSKSNEAKKTNQEVAKSASEQIASLMKLSVQWKTFGNDLEAKKRFLKENGDEIKKLTGKTLDLVKADDLFIKNTGKFIEALIFRARAEQKQKELQKKTEDIGNVDQKIDAEYEKLLKKGGTIDGKTKEKDSDRLMLVYTSQKYQELKEERKKYTKEAEEFINEQIKLTEREKTILKELGLGAEDILEGSIAAVESKISELNKQYKNAATDKERNALLTQIKEQENLLKKLDKTRSSTTKSDKDDPFTKQLEERKKRYSEYLKWINSTDETIRKAAPIEFANILKDGNTYLEYLQKLKQKTTLTKQEIYQVTNEIVSETNKGILETFKESLVEKLDNAKTVVEQLNLIKKMRDDLKTSDDPETMKQEKEKVLDETQKQKEKEQREEQKKKAESVLKEYTDTYDRLLDLDKEYFDDRALLNKQEEAALTDEEKQRINRTIAYRKQKYDEDVQNILRAAINANVKMIELERDNTLFDISQKKYLWEADRQKDVLTAQKKAAEDTLEQLKKLQGEDPTGELADEIARITLEIKKMNDELEKTPNEKLQEMLSGLQKITSSLGGLDGELGEIFSSISSQLDNIKVAFDENAKTTDKVSAGIAGIVDIINTVTAASAKRKQVEKEYYQNQIALAHEYALALNGVLRTQSEMSESGFVKDYSGRINDGFNALTDATKNYHDALGKLSEGKAKIDLRNAIDWGAVGKSAVSGAVAGAAIGSIVPVIGTTVGAVVGGVVGGIVGLFGGKKKKEIYGGLLDVFPELVDGAGNLNKELAQTLINTNQVDDKTKQLIQNALEWADVMESAHAQVKEVVVELAGDLGNSLKNSIVEAWKAGEDASKSMFDAASKSLEKFVEDLLYSTLFSDVFKEFSDRLAESLSPSGDGDILDDYDWLMDEMNARDDYFIGLLEQVKNRAKERGFNAWEDSASNDKSLTGAVKGITEETASMLGGQINVMRINQLEANEMIRQQLMYLATIAQNTSYNRFLQSIDEKLERLKNSGDPLRSQGLS